MSTAKKVKVATSVHFTGCGFGVVNVGPYIEGIIDSDGDDLMIMTVNGKCYVNVSVFNMSGNQGVVGSTSFKATGRAFRTDMNEATGESTDTDIGSASLAVKIDNQQLTMTGTVAGKAESYNLPQTYGNPVMYI